MNFERLCLEIARDRSNFILRHRRLVYPGDRNTYAECTKKIHSLTVASDEKISPATFLRPLLVVSVCI